MIITTPKTGLTLSALALALTLATGSALADDRVSMGSDIHVGAGEVVGDVLSMGGDIRVDGIAEGDVATAGGDVVVTGAVEGDVTTAGGDIHIDGLVEGDVATAGGTIPWGPNADVHGDVKGGAFERGSAAAVAPGSSEAAVAGSSESVVAGFLRRLGAFALLFLLAFAFRVLAKDRFHTLRAAMVREPLKAPLVGMAFLCGAIVAILGTAVTVVGIPVAIVLAMSLALAVYVGLAMTAAVLGAVLPVERLQGRENAQLAAGVGLLFFVSLVPFFGTAALVLATLFGLGAVAMTRVGGRPLVPAPEGPYR